MQRIAVKFNGGVQAGKRKKLIKFLIVIWDYDPPLVEVYTFKVLEI